MAHITYVYYTDTYKGSAVASEDFAVLSERASAQINLLTSDRVAAILTDGTDTATVDKIKMATCAVMEEIQASSSEGNADGIESERIGNYAVTYGSNASKSKPAIIRYRDIAKVYLGNTYLMFLGFYSGEYGGSLADESEL